MAKIVLATFGSLGDLYPKIALGIELERRGHDVAIAAMEFYREKIGQIGLGFHPMAPHLDPNDDSLAKDLMDNDTGSETILREIIMPSLPAMYDDLVAATAGADLVVSGEITYAIKSLVERRPISNGSRRRFRRSLSFPNYDPPVPPPAPWFENLRFLGPAFHGLVFSLRQRQTMSGSQTTGSFAAASALARTTTRSLRASFRETLTLRCFQACLASRSPIGRRRRCRPAFAFTRQADSGKMPEGLEDFLDSGEPPIVFTLGSAAVMDPGEFFNESIKAAKAEAAGGHAIRHFQRTAGGPDG